MPLWAPGRFVLNASSGRRGASPDSEHSVRDASTVDQRSLGGRHIHRWQVVAAVHRCGGSRYRSISSGTQQRHRCRGRIPIDNPATIEQLSDHPSALPIAAQWIWETWGTKTLEETIELLGQPSDCPPTLIALIDKKPVGVLGFGRWRRPDEAVDSLWINSLFVLEGERSRGLGSQLLATAVEMASSFANELNVFTDIPSWYERRGWVTIDESDDGSVLRRPLSQAVTPRR